MSPEQAQLWLQAAQTTFIVVGGLFAGRTYLRDSAVKKAEWLERLHDKFFYTDEYKRVRRILDYGSIDNYASFKEAISSDVANEDQEDLIDYLNFFHFVAALWKNSQLKDDEVKMLFDYYVCLLTKHDFIMEYMKREGFHNLLGMIHSFGYARADCNEV